MTRTQWMVVIGLLFFILVIFGILILQLQVPEAAATAPPPAFLLEQPAQARAVLPIAQAEATRWQADAQLAAASVVWDDFGPGGILKRDRWTFQFYSPAEQQMVVIRVVDGQAERLRTALVPNPLPALPVGLWRTDSAQALQTWWDRGGGSFVRRHSSVSISLKLRPDPKGNRLLWVVAGSSGDQHWVAQIDARSGSVLQ